MQESFLREFLAAQNRSTEKKYHVFVSFLWGCFVKKKTHKPGLDSANVFSISSIFSLKKAQRSFSRDTFKQRLRLSTCLTSASKPGPSLAISLSGLNQTDARSYTFWIWFLKVVNLIYKNLVIQQPTILNTPCCPPTSHQVTNFDTCQIGPMPREMLHKCRRGHELFQDLWHSSLHIGNSRNPNRRQAKKKKILATQK